MKVVYKRSAPLTKRPSRNIPIVPIVGGIILVIVLVVVSSRQVLGTRSSAPESSPHITNTQTAATDVVPSIISYSKVPPAGYSGFFEEFVTVNDQLVYIAIPLNINLHKKPEIVAYYHGSTRPIVNDFSTEWMPQVRSLAATAVSYNKIFVASNQHGDNFGNPIAVDDTLAAINWVQQNFPVATPQYSLVGFSMGGLGALRHAITYPTQVRKMALIAPANHLERYSEPEKESLATVATVIWHSTDDENISVYYSEQLHDAITESGGSWGLMLLTQDTHIETLTHRVSEIAGFLAQ